MSEPKTTTQQLERQQTTNPQATETAPTTTLGDLVGKSQPSVTTAPQAAENIRQGADPYPDQKLDQVLARQYVIDQFQWHGTAATGALITTYSFPRDLVNIAPFLKTKLDYYQYFTCKAVSISLRIDATQWHQGALLICWIPHYREGTTLNYQQTIFTAANLNCSILSANTNTTVEIQIPNVAPSQFWNMKDDPTSTADGFFGKVFVYNLAPLRLKGDATTPTVLVSTFAKFIEPAVAGWGLRVFAPLEAQSSDDEQDMKTEMKSMGSKFAKNSKKKVKNTVMDVSTMAMGTLSSLLDIGLGALTDKPTDKQIPTKIRVDNNTGFCLANGADCSEMLGMSPENKIANDPSVFGEKKDYNLFDNYKQLPSLIILGSYDASTAVGTKLEVFPVNPMFCHFFSVSTFNNFETTHIANLASFFRYWRGSLKYHIQIFTTKFTQGRILVKWIPDPTFSSAISNGDFGDTVSHVIDFAGDTSYSFSIPYLRESKWLDRVSFLDAQEGATVNWNGHNGQLIIQTLNPLIVGDATADALVNYAIWISGGPDFQVAMPNGFADLTKWSDGTVPITLAQESINKAEKKVLSKTRHFAQSGEDGITLSTDMRALFEKPFPTLVPTNVTITTNLTMGEEVTSFTELGRRFTMQATLSSSTASNEFKIAPHFPAIGQTDIINRILKTFHYHRGSFRHKYEPTLILAGTWSFYVHNTTLVDTYTFPNDPVGSTGLAMIGTETGRRILEWQAPFYFNFDMVSRSPYGAETTNLPCTSVIISRSDSLSDSTCNAQLWTSFGDDFSLAWAVPPMVWKFDTSLTQKAPDTGLPLNSETRKVSSGRDKK